jgi:hypothetical protein
MKKIVFAALLTAISVTGFSQGLRLGVCLNPHFTWFSENSDKMKSNGTRTGIEGGLAIEHYFAKNYAFATGIHLGTFGGKMVYLEDSLDFRTNDKVQKVPPNLEVKYKLQYISVPIDLKLKTNQIGFMSYFARLGFNFQLNIGAKADAPPALNNDDAGKEVGLFNMAYHFGGGVEYGVGGNTAIVLGLDYNNGFFDILTKQEGRQSLSYLTINVGVMF